MIHELAPNGKEVVYLALIKRDVSLVERPGTQPDDSIVEFEEAVSGMLLRQTSRAVEKAN